MMSRLTVPWSQLEMRPQCQASDRAPLANEAEHLMETLQPRIHKRQLQQLDRLDPKGFQPSICLSVKESYRIH